MEFKIKDLEEIFNTYKVDAEDIFSGKIKSQDEYFGYIGDSFGEICDSINNNQLNIFKCYEGLKQKGFNILIETIIGFVPPLFDHHKRYFLPESALFRLRQKLKVQSFIDEPMSHTEIMNAIEDKLNG